MTHTTEPLSKPHVIRIPGLSVPKLTEEQAAIVMGYTRYKTMDRAELAQHVVARNGIGLGFGTQEMKRLFEEDFQRICPGDNNTGHEQLTGRLMQILANEMHGPVSIWDNRVDVFIDGHLPQATEAAIREDFAQSNTTVEFTKRPGVTPQTWVTIDRPDHTDVALQVVAGSIAIKLLEAMKEQLGDGDVEVTALWYVPDAHEQALIELLGPIANQPGYDSITLTRVFRNKGVTKITLGRAQGPGN